MTTDAIKQALLFHADDLWMLAIESDFNIHGGVRTEFTVSYPDILPGGIEAYITLIYRFFCKYQQGGERDELIPRYQFDWCQIAEILLFNPEGDCLYCDADVNEIEQALNEEGHKKFREF